MKKLFDLRFVIGAFFLIVGILLVGYYLLGANDIVGTGSINIKGGMLYIIFGLLMIVLSYAGKQEQNL